MHPANRLIKRNLGRFIPLASMLVVMLASCGRAPDTSTASNPSPPPADSGVEIATVGVTPPPGNSGRKLFAGLKREGRIVGRGEATVTETGPVQVVIRALDKDTKLPDGTYDLWLVIDRDGLQSCNPSFGDIYLHQTWQWPTVGRVVELRDVSAWTLKKSPAPENIVTVHYHRYDDDYEDVGIWTWDGNYKRSPEQAEIFEVGRDDYGPIFQFDRGEYGEHGDSDKIGVLPRLGLSWERKDGDDKFWRPEMGKEIYLIGTKNQVFTKRPDITPQVVAAYIDTPNLLVVQTSRPLSDSEANADKITIKDDQGREIGVASARLALPPRKNKSNTIELTTARPLDIGERVYKVSLQNFAGAAQVLPRGVLDDPALYGDTNAVLGATYTPQATTFRVFAPTARAVQVIVYDEATGGKGRAAYPMQSTAKGIWECAVPGDLKGKYYVYSLDGPDLLPDREVVDIYAVNTIHNTTRARITDLAATNPTGWQTAKNGPALQSPVDMVVYEMHVRDFTIATNSPASPEHRGKYLGFAEAADYLKELGVTHVQLMPLQDFENDEAGTNYNWGYVTMAFNSPDGWYATNIDDDSRVREFKQLVKALHERGIGVIMDVVYNHTASNAPFNALVPRYYYRYLPDGRVSNGSGCGNDFRSEAPMARKYILESLKYWVQEYGIDGFRFDLMALMDLDTMKQVERELRAIKPTIVLYGEPWGGGGAQAPAHPTNKQTIVGTHLGAFNDNIRNALVGSPFEEKNGGFVQNGSSRNEVERAVEGNWRLSGNRPDQAINFISCHDNWVVRDKLKLSKPGATDQSLKDMTKIGYLLLFTSQGVPFMHGGDEFARTKNGNGNSYNAPDAINEVDWSLKEKNHDLFAYVRDLIALRKAHPVFRIRAKEQIAAWLKFIDTGDPNVLMFTIDGSGVDGESWKQVCVIVNATDSTTADVALPPGEWRIAFDRSGAVTSDEHAQGTAQVPSKSGMILYQP